MGAADDTASHRSRVDVIRVRRETAGSKHNPHPILSDLETGRFDLAPLRRAVD